MLMNINAIVVFCKLDLLHAILIWCISLFNSFAFKYYIMRNINKWKSLKTWHYLIINTSASAPTNISSRLRHTGTAIRLDELSEEKMVFMYFVARFLVSCHLNIKKWIIEFSLVSLK